MKQKATRDRHKKPARRQERIEWATTDQVYLRQVRKKKKGQLEQHRGSITYYFIGTYIFRFLHGGLFR